MADTLAPDRIVAGVTSGRAEGVLRQIYAGPLAAGSQFFATGLETAELAKVAANSFLATKISFINAMAEVCEATGGDVGALAEIIGADPRIGPAFLRPGLGFGGGCLPKDIRAFIAWVRTSRRTKHSGSCARWTRLTCGGGPGPPIWPAKWSAGTWRGGRMRTGCRIQARIR